MTTHLQLININNKKVVLDYTSLYYLINLETQRGWFALKQSTSCPLAGRQSPVNKTDVLLINPSIYTQSFSHVQRFAANTCVTAAYHRVQILLLLTSMTWFRVF